MTTFYYLNGNSLVSTQYQTTRNSLNNQYGLIVKDTGCESFHNFSVYSVIYFWSYIDSTISRLSTNSFISFLYFISSRIKNRGLRKFREVNQLRNTKWECKWNTMYLRFDMKEFLWVYKNRKI